ncbi:MAG TPA: DUF1508 domain-containing protein [Mycobacterium sp.]|nr:DUF1508 domain-containing protein [Mycobacterium sp.]HTX95556.1 DUF1508 domain-containing protein [Mycobacterium sp.]
MAAEFIIYRDKNSFRWFLTADNGDVIVRHEHAYTSREEAETAIQSVIDNVPNATVVDDGEPPDDEEAAAARRAAESRAKVAQIQQYYRDSSQKNPLIIKKDGGAPRL